MSRVEKAWAWLGRHDAGYGATRRAGRTAIVMPALFAFGSEVVGNVDVATFAAFGTFAMLLFADFTGTRRERLEAMTALGVAGAVLVVVGTLASSWAVVAALAMAVVGFGVLFSGVVSSVLAGSSTSLLLAFVLPVATPAPVSAIPDRLAGWALAAVVALAASTLLWPAPPRDALRTPAARCCRLLAARLRTDVAVVMGDLADDAVRDAADREARDAVTALRTGFYAAPNRPTGLSTSARTVVRLVDELGWFTSVLDQSPATRMRHARHQVSDVKLGVADVLDRCADLLEAHGGDTRPLHDALDVLSERLETMESTAVSALPDPTLGSTAVDALEPTFRAQELAFAAREIAANTDRAARAERRTWWQRVTGRQPQGVGGPVEAAWERARAHLDLRSVWLHNSLRGAAGLGVAVLVSDLSGVQHSFWVVLGTLSVLRSNALSTGQNVLRGLAGTTLGIVVGGVIVWGVGTNRAVLWVLLPVCVVLAGLAPAAVSFLAGQAAFTMTIVILFNIIAPVGYAVGLVRVEDVALGCAVSVVVGLLFWPRGATSVLGRALGDAYDSAARYLAQAVAYGARRCEQGLPQLPAPTAEAALAAAASRRLDDAFREYLAERGGKKLHLSEVTTLVTGTIAPRLAADAVLDLWAREDGTTGGDRTAAGRELDGGAAHLLAWYQGFSAALRGGGAVPAPMPRDLDVDGRLVTAVRHDLADHAGLGTPTAVRMIWTGDHLDAVRRQQDALVGPAATIARPGPTRVPTRSEELPV